MAKPLIISVKGDSTRGPALWYPETSRMYGLGAGDDKVLDGEHREVTAATYDDARTKALVQHGYGRIEAGGYVAN